MKRFLGLLILSFCINSCDDGEFEIQSFDFSSIAATECVGANESFFIYYTNEREALFVQIDEENFENIITPQDDPRIVTINATNKVTYRVYNGNVTAASICSTIPPLSPVPVEEWTATSGVIEIITSANKQTNETTGQSFITGYTHTIKLVNTLFVKGDGNQQLFSELFLGNYVTPANPPTITTANIIYSCSNFDEVANLNYINNLDYIFQINGNQTIILESDGTLFQNSEATAANPRTAVIDGANTKITFLVFESAVLPFCIQPTAEDPEPDNPEPTGSEEEWIGENGSSSSSTGIIEVTTVQVFDQPTQTLVYRHTIFLRKVSFKKDGTTFTFGDLYQMGTIDTQL